MSYPIAESKPHSKARDLKKYLEREKSPRTQQPRRPRHFYPLILFVLLSPM